MDHRLDPSGPSIPTRGHAGGITRRRDLSQPMGSMLMFLVAVHGLDTSPNVPEEDPDQTPRPAGRDWKNRAIGGAALVFDVAKAAAEAFGPLKAALEAASTVYDQYKVRSWHPS